MKYNINKIIENIEKNFAPYSLIRYSELLQFFPVFVNDFNKSDNKYTASGYLRSEQTYHYLIRVLIKKKVIKSISRRLYKRCAY